MGAGTSKPKPASGEAAISAAIQSLPAPYEKNDMKYFYLCTAMDEELQRVSEEGCARIGPAEAATTLHAACLHTQRHI
jgi:hypothetical protein